jgi:uncharacterized protein
VQQKETVMIKEFWINLPVKDINRSIDFFTQLGFSFNPVPGNPHDSACMVVGNKNIIVMLFEESSFKSFTNHNITDSKSSTEVLFSIDAENREEVNDLANKVKNAGGTIYNGPGERNGWMYGFGFADLDGHRWSVLFMDRGKMPEMK